MRSASRPVVILVLASLLVVGVSACGGSGSSSTGARSGTSGFGGQYRSASARLLRPAIISGYEHGGATPAQAKKVAACVIPLLAKHGITSLSQLGTSAAPSLAHTITAACQKKLGIR